MAEPAAPLAPLRPRKRRFRDMIGGRELLLGALAVGMMLGVSWIDDRYTCERIDEHGAAVVVRDASLSEFSEARCAELGCANLERVSTRGCLAKIRFEAERTDEYGEVRGTFVTVEGLSYSPLLERWRVREVLDDKQVLGLPVGGS